MTRRALITGATGFAGRHLADQLAAHGADLLGSTSQGPARTALSAGGLPMRVVPCNFCRPDENDAFLQATQAFQPTEVYHLAGLSIAVDCGSTDPTDVAWQINVEGTRQILALAKTLSPVPRVLVVSSSHVYAGSDAPVNEEANLAPRNGYGKTKLAAEELARQAFDAGVPVIIARSFQHTGPGQSYRMMLPEWARQFAQGAVPVEVHTCGATIDLCDVRDVVLAYQLLMQAGQPGRVYNVGSGIARTSGDVLALLRQVADPNRPIRELRPGKKHDAIADSTRIRNEIGWRPSIPIERTVADTWNFWREQASA